MSRPPHHTENGRFRNPWPDAEVRGWLDVFKWRLIDNRLHPPPPDPDPAVLPRVGPPAFPASAAELACTWLGHSTVLVEVEGKRILTDPVWSERVSPLSWTGPERWVPPQLPLEALPAIDLVVLSHNHYDHLDQPTVEWLARERPQLPWIVPLKLAPTLRKFGVRVVTELDWWQSAEVAGVTVTGTPAQHFSARNLFDRGATLWCGYTMQVGKRRVYFAGDTGYHPEFTEIGRRLGPFDLMLIPVGAYEPRWFMRTVHMNPEDALSAVKDLHSAHPDRLLPPVLPIHWGTYKLTDEPIDEPPLRFRELWTAAGLDSGGLWLLAHGERREG
ncbi:MAG TPA: MBL fold metallo-hydrolase [Gemmatimonadales bacterium]|nr:MBL fold metallo-hydrolase [Gemmatimonadales bacterium]